MFGLNAVETACVATMILGALILFGIFDRVGFVDTPKRMRMLGWTVVAIGFAIGMTQSTPT